MLEHEHQAMAQTLRVLARQRHAQPHVRIRQRDHQAMHVRHLASDPGPGHAEIDLHAARRPLEPHVPLAIRHAAVRLAPPVHVTHRGRILAVVVRLRQQTVVHAPDRVPLLPGQQTIGLQPLVHQMRVRVDLRPVPAIRLRLGRAILHIRVLRDRPAIHVKTPRYLRARHSLPVESPDILHNGHRYRHVPFLPERRPAATGRIKTDWQLGNIQAAAPMPITSPGNDDDTGENHQPTLRKNTAEPVEQTLKQNTLRGVPVFGLQRGHAALAVRPDPAMPRADARAELFGGPLLHATRHRLDCPSPGLQWDDGFGHMAGIPGIHRQPTFQALPGRITQMLHHLGRRHRRGEIQLHRTLSFLKTGHTKIFPFGLQENVRSPLSHCSPFMEA